MSMLRQFALVACNDLVAGASSFGKLLLRLERPVRSQPRFRTTSRVWHTRGAVPAGIKRAAIVGMFGSYVVFFVSAIPGPRLAIPLGIIMLGCVVCVLSRPSL